jgi:hypothetical protein
MIADSHRKLLQASNAVTDEPYSFRKGNISTRKWPGYVQENTSWENIRKQAVSRLETPQSAKRTSMEQNTSVLENLRKDVQMSILDIQRYLNLGWIGVCEMLAEKCSQYGRLDVYLATVSVIPSSATKPSPQIRENSHIVGDGPSFSSIFLIFGIS